MSKKETMGKGEVEIYLVDPSEDACNDKFDILSGRRTIAPNILFCHLLPKTCLQFLFQW